MLQSISTEFPPLSESTLRVLIVDDNDDAALTLEMLVQHEGHHALIAHCGPTAIAAAIKHRPDVILLDIGLPGFDGYEVAKRIRREPSLCKTVLVAMSGYGPEADDHGARESAFDHHLIKPVDFEIVRQILANVLKKAT